MLQKPFISVTIDGLPVSVSDIQEVSMYSSIDMTLPELTFKLNDPQGILVNQLKVYVGALISIKITNFDHNQANTEKSATESYCDFVVTKMFDGFENGDERLAGFIQVWCKPNWYMFGDYQGHAYPPQKLSSLIKSICQNANSANELVIEDDNFYESSDPGNTPRYKTCESDLEFIERKLLPYTNIDDSNVFFYIDWFNKPHLTSFSKMIAQKESFLIMPPTEISTSIMNKVQGVIKEKNISEFASWENIELSLGSENFKYTLALLKQTLVLENNQTSKVYLGSAEPATKLGKDSGKTFNSKVPISALRMEAIEATSCFPFPNRSLPDALAMARNKDVNLIDIMSISVSIGRIANTITPGQTIFLFTPLMNLEPLNKSETNPATDEEKKKIISWLNGKWLCKSVQYIQTDGAPEKVQTNLTLVRPTLSFNSDSTTLAMPSYFYTIG